MINQLIHLFKLHILLALNTKNIYWQQIAPNRKSELSESRTTKVGVGGEFTCGTHNTNKQMHFYPHETSNLPAWLTMQSSKWLSNRPTHLNLHITRLQKYKPRRAYERAGCRIVPRRRRLHGLVLRRWSTYIVGSSSRIVGSSRGLELEDEKL